jgi:hypothetical protein
LSGLIDPTQIVSTFIALLPVDLCIAAVVLSINKKVRAMWVWYQMFPTLTEAQARFAKWWMERSLADEMEKQSRRWAELREMEPDKYAKVPPWVSA